MVKYLLLRCIYIASVIQVSMAFNVGIINLPIRTVEPIFRHKKFSSRLMCAPLHSDLLLDTPVDAVTLLTSPTADASVTERSMVQSELKAPSNLSFNGPMSYGPHLKLKGAVLNVWGLAYGLSLLVSSVLLLPMLFVLTAIADVTGDTKRRRALDWLIHYWARLSLKMPNLLLFNSPTVYGMQNLPPENEAVVYVPNHTTFFDILLLSGYIPRPFKYVSKIEISKIPIIGLSMKRARHVFLDRHNINSAAECAETVHQRLLDGNSMVLFAEGTRSSDGRLRLFKKGAFQMAKRANVRVVPVSIGHLHRIMPSEAAMPLSSLRHTYIQIHPAIYTTDKSVKEIQNACFTAVNSGLPDYQQYIAPDAVIVNETSCSTNP